jgi:nicotinate-nucleotide pyrophosphorylase (carboxylating)
MAGLDGRLIDDIVHRALREDLGDAGDVTSSAVFTAGAVGSAQVRSKGDGVLSGGYLIEPVFTALSPDVRVVLQVDDGRKVETGTVIAEVEGPVRAILSGERTVLNFLQRLSGIATLTARLVTAIGDGPARILDTRKTTPTLRALEKKAVRDGGGHNHRFGLYDMVLIKDTHVRAAGGVRAALQGAKAAQDAQRPLKVEIEVQSREEFFEAASEQPDRIMLDNMNLTDMSACVEHVRSNGLSIELEASGRVSEDTIAAVAQTGVDYISVGSITHSAPALDIHMVML